MSFEQFENCEALNLEEITGGAQPIGEHVKVRHHLFSDKTTLITELYSDQGEWISTTKEADDESWFEPAS